MKYIQACVWKALSFSMKTCYNLVMKYSIPSFVSMLFFLLYMFLPLVFVVLICSVLVSALVGGGYRAFFHADRKGFKNVEGYRKNDDKTPILKNANMGTNCSVLDKGQTTRRRNAKDKDRKDYIHSCIEEKNVASPAGFDGDLGNKNAVREENLKELREVKANVPNEKAGPCLRDASQIVVSPALISSCIEEPSKFSGVEAETEGESSEDLEEEDAHEDTHEVPQFQGQTNDFNTIQEGHASKLVFNSFDNYHEEDGCEVKTKQNLHEEINRSISSSSSEDDIPLCTAHKVEFLRSLSSLARKDIDVARDDNDQENDVLYNTDRLLYEKTKDNSYFGEKSLCHAPSNSLASDLQVEVSEVSSPQSTSSNEKSSLFDNYINKEATSGCDDICVGLSQLSGEAINESDSREVNEIGEQDANDVGFSRINHNLNPDTSNLQPEKVTQQDKISQLSQHINLPESIQGQTNDFNPECHSASYSSDAPPAYDSEHSTERVVAHTFNSKNLEEASPQQVNVVEEASVNKKDENESSKYSKVIIPDVVEKVSIPNEENYWKSLEDTNSTLKKQSGLNLFKAWASISD